MRVVVHPIGLVARQLASPAGELGGGSFLQPDRAALVRVDVQETRSEALSLCESGVDLVGWEVEEHFAGEHEVERPVESRGAEVGVHHGDPIVMSEPVCRGLHLSGTDVERDVPFDARENTEEQCGGAAEPAPDLQHRADVTESGQDRAQLVLLLGEGRCRVGGVGGELGHVSVAAVCPVGALVEAHAATVAA